MKTINLGQSDLRASCISLGCMRMGDKSVAQAAQVLAAASEIGIDFFDHADIYAGGKSEEIFAAALTQAGLRRQDILLQSKCGIRKGLFDFSREHIVDSVESSLRRLKTDYLDVLVLHRPDTLFEPDEVAAAFDHLQQSGKVRHFGVSNQHALQIELLKQSVRQPLLVNQLQFSIMHTGMIDAGFNVNMTNPAASDRDGAILEYSRLHQMTIQAWSPFQYGFFSGVFLDNEQFPELNAVIDRLAAQYGVKNTAIAVAWILRHPAQMQVIVGSMNAGRLRDIGPATGVALSRAEWYEIYRAAGNVLP
ncbi:aldo/keto reductase family oxidoreductase [Affinibrenneria salicis]|uniref:Aldo/keto reductase family oxidoreductase n=1 Tax=Affinibrenneria salicis TaxID=2590031 RepID=A0A5J5G4P9_9GAMM|nr:aldo/keto reductase [Affinibrenneria salicis]KAA9002019.1 aldo/keto reductase family oxidoreductase [Affinibrenneria salicis]